MQKGQQIPYYNSGLTSRPADLLVQAVHCKQACLSFIGACLACTPSLEGLAKSLVEG